MVSWRATGNIVIRRSRCPVRVRVLYIIGGFFSKECLSAESAGLPSVYIEHSRAIPASRARICARMSAFPAG